MGQQRDEHRTWQQHQAGKDACQHYTMWTSMSRALWNEAQTQAVQCTARNHHCTASCDVLQCRVEQNSAVVQCGAVDWASPPVLELVLVLTCMAGASERWPVNAGGADAERSMRTSPCALPLPWLAGE